MQQQLWLTTKQNVSLTVLGLSLLLQLNVHLLFQYTDQWRQIYSPRTGSVTNILLNTANYYPGMLATFFSVVIVNLCVLYCTVSVLTQSNFEYAKETLAFLVTAFVM